MIYLYGVECAGCDAKILLRVSVGLDLVQPFFFVCDRCQTPTNVRQLIEYKPVPHAWLELEAGRQIDASGLKPDQVVNIDPELTSLPTAEKLEDRGGSPFLMHHQLVGERFPELLSRIKRFRDVTDRDWSAFKRLGGFYVRRNWDRFDKEGKRLLEEEWPDLPHEAARHDLFNHLLKAIFMPLVVQHTFVQAVIEFGGFLNAHAQNRKIACAFCQEQEQSGLMSTLQQDVLRRFNFVVEHRSALLSALPLEFYLERRKGVARDLRLFRDEFDVLKLHYLDSYELGYKVLAPVIGFVNALERGDADSFNQQIVNALIAEGKRNFSNLADLGAFSKQPNAPKVAFLGQLPVLQAMWKAVLFPKLRNAMGHHDARHDLRSGMIVTGEETELAYTEVALTAVRLIPMLLMLAHLLKMLAMSDFLLREEESPNTGAGMAQ
ncbi:MAG: hypothetical protein ACYSVY_01320 [Planctomycetota bacterium]|jgi:hypothetical protein